MAPGEVNVARDYDKTKEPLNTTTVVHPTGILQSAPLNSQMSHSANDTITHTKYELES
jgi:hypothetical protein